MNLTGSNAEHLVPEERNLVPVLRFTGSPACLVTKNCLKMTGWRFFQLQQRVRGG